MHLGSPRGVPGPQPCVLSGTGPLDSEREGAMRCLSYSECEAWCRHHDYPVVEADHHGRPAPAIRKHFRAVKLSCPVDSGKKVGLARDVVKWLDGAGELLLWLGDWAVWPSSQHLPLFTRFREAFGEMRPLIEAPGHLIQRGELDDAVSVLATALLFIWDCHVFSAVRRPVFFCSHDEWSAFFVPPDFDPKPIHEAFSRWLPDGGAEVTSVDA